MKTYTVIGEYGIQSDQYVEKVYRARSPENAVRRFIREVRPTVGDYTWNCMKNNINIRFIEA